MTQQNVSNEQQFTFNTGDLAWMVSGKGLVSGIVTSADKLYWSVLWSSSFFGSDESHHMPQSVAYRYTYHNAVDVIQRLKLTRNASYP